MKMIFDRATFIAGVPRLALNLTRRAATHQPRSQPDDHTESPIVTRKGSVSAATPTRPSISAGRTRAAPFPQFTATPAPSDIGTGWRTRQYAAGVAGRTRPCRRQLPGIRLNRVRVAFGLRAKAAVSSPPRDHPRCRQEVDPWPAPWATEERCHHPLAGMGHYLGHQYRAEHSQLARPRSGGRRTRRAEPVGRRLRCELPELESVAKLLGVSRATLYHHATRRAAPESGAEPTP
jgi:hypothetical protein